ncbi:MAG: sulfatase, partial [Anaerolineales bacterium]
MPKRNILFIMTDEHRWDYMGYMDHPVQAGLTPGFDRIADEGVTFTNCFSPNPLCMPARNAIHTGLYTFQSGQMNNVGDWPMYFPTFTQALQEMGYHTALTGKIHAHEAVGYDIDLTDKRWDDEIHDLGFDDVVQVAGKTMDFFTEDAYTHYLRERGLLYAYREDIVERTEAGAAGEPAWWPSILPEEHYIDNFIGCRAVEWLEAYDDERPFFHMVSFCSPHPSYDAYESALARIDKGAIAPPVANERAEFYTDMIANYAAQIHIVDRNVGRILDVLERRGCLEDTLIVFTADHGEMLGDMGKGGKCWWEDASVRVPLLVRCKDWSGPRIASDVLVSCHDVAATMLDFAAGEDRAEEFLPGCSSRSLRPFLTGETDKVRDVVYSENGGQFVRPWRMVDDGTYRYVRLLEPEEELLFDRRDDPRCLHDVASEAENIPIIECLREEMLRVHLRHPTPKAGPAGYSPRVPHRITRER